MALLRRALHLAALLLHGGPRGCAAAEPWEWAGVFDFQVPGHFTWSAARVNGTYAAASMRLLLHPAAGADAGGLAGAEDSAMALWNSSSTIWTRLLAGEGMEVGSAYELSVDQQSWVSHYFIHIETPGAVAFFAEHAPMEFESGFHFLRTESGADVEPGAATGSGAHSEATESGHEGHSASAHSEAMESGHEDHFSSVDMTTTCTPNLWEWAGIFQLGAGHYIWNAARGADGAYADTSINLLMLDLGDLGASSTALVAAGVKAQSLWESATWFNKQSLQPLPLSTANTLQLDEHTWVSHFRVEIASPRAVAVFAQHSPGEFDNGFHYFKTEEGVDVEPAVVSECAAELASSGGDDWPMVLLGAFVTCLPALLGLLCAMWMVAPNLKAITEACAPSINGFASGVVFAAAVFLLLPEALHLAGAGHDDETVGAWTWGFSILLGWFTCLLIQHGCHLRFSGGQPHEGSDKEVAHEGTEAGLTKYGSRWVAVAMPVLFGDLFHNFSDGLVIGTAFKGCDHSFAWKLVGVSVAHEVPSELADLAVLILDARMRWQWATLANFATSLSTVVGAAISYGTTVGTNEQGWILAYGAGVYLFVALTELGPRVAELDHRTLRESVLKALPFMLGCALIGLVLMDHKHCEEPVGVTTDSVAATGGDGHDHR